MDKRLYQELSTGCTLRTGGGGSRITVGGKCTDLGGGKKDDYTVIRQPTTTSFKVGGGESHDPCQIISVTRIMRVLFLSFVISFL